MKRIFYQKIYDALSLLSNRFNSKFLMRYKVLLGMSLLILSGCSKEPEEPEVTCYVIESPDETEEVRSLSPEVPESLINMEDISE